MADDPVPTETALRDEPFAAPVVSSEVVFDGAIWDVRRETFVYDGAEVVREFVAHPGAAAVVALDDRDRMLVIQQYRHPVRSRDWEIPAGLLDVAGESPLDAARRELAEEADMAADDWEPLVSVATTPGGNDEVVHVFVARGLRPVQTSFVRDAEEADIVVRWVPLPEVVDAVLDGRVRNNILAVAALAAAHRG